MAARLTRAEFMRAALLGVVLRILTAMFLWEVAPPATAPERTGKWSRVAGDTRSYLLPAEHVLSDGSYVPDSRPPGYAAAYIAVRLLFDANRATDAIVVAQIALSGIALAAFAAVAVEISGRKAFGALAFVLFAASSFTATYDTVLLTESFAVSGLILLALILFRLRRFPSRRIAAAAGALGLWIVFLRPVLGAVVVLFALWLARITKKTVALAFILPLTLGLVLWGTRGLVVNGRFEPLGLRYSPEYRPADRALHTFVQSFGGSLVHWDPKAEIIWFEFSGPRQRSVSPTDIAEIRFPADMYTSVVTPQALLDVKSKLLSSLQENDARSRSLIQDSAAADLARMTESIRTERPFLYYVKAPLRILWRHLAHSGTENLLSRPWRELPYFLLFFKLASSLLYVFVAFGGIAGVIAQGVRPERDRDGWILIGIAFLTPLLIQTTVLRLDEYRYFAPSYPFALLFATSAMTRLFARESEKSGEVG